LDATRRLPELRWPFRIAGGCTGLAMLFACAASVVVGLRDGAWSSSSVIALPMLPLLLVMGLAFTGAAFSGRVPRGLWAAFVRITSAAR
jgi:hypothetical protein